MLAKTHIRLGDRLYALSEGLIMGIMNLTPDSFYPDSRTASIDQFRLRVDTMLSEGMDILDLGAMSSRPGAQIIPPEVEWSRLEPYLQVLATDWPGLPVSVDTVYAETARRSVHHYGVKMVNDISAGMLDPGMPDMIASLGVPVVLMHMQNQPDSMQSEPRYSHVTHEVIQFLASRLEVYRAAGVQDLIVDPGFGFGKTLEHNFTLLNELDRLLALDCPLLIGISRKSMIYRLLETDPAGSLNGSTALHAIARMKGAQIFRVHDVREARESITLANRVLFSDQNHQK